ncbi:hypothetical protein VH571_15725 [Frondihabitans sp. 4ASC-45]|uniref:hypothetical protein n=1 Tax=Frondihabitans sp. 4ASC-45 TaxID=3111636 RepID=UPI003C15278F
MTATLPDEFDSVWSEQSGDHRLTIVEATGTDWLMDVAAIYRELRTSTDEVLDPSVFADIDVVDVQQIQARYLRTMIPPRAGGNFSVIRSDLAEALMGYLGEKLHGYLYGYRSTRDRELVHLPGRGVDQIGVTTSVDSAGRDVVVVLIGEAKVSAEAKSPPAVVETKDDSLRNQHLDHMSDMDKLIGKIAGASRRARGDAFMLFQVALAHLEKGNHDQVHLRSASLLVRPAGHGAETDFGSFRSAPDDFHPGKVDFMIVRTDAADIEATIDLFHQLASTDPDAPEEGES